MTSIEDEPSWSTTEGELTAEGSGPDQPEPVATDPEAGEPLEGEPAGAEPVGGEPAGAGPDRPGAEGEAERVDPGTQDEPGERARAGEPDQVCAAAVDLARAGLDGLTPAETIGAHLGVRAEGERLVTHYFDCLLPGYRGWRWAVTVSRVPRARTATVCESVLLPGDEAILPPPWVPWSDRLAPGDLGPHDVLPYRADDPNLDPGYTETSDEEEDRLAIWELGLGRPRVLNRQGRDLAATRWYTGDRGPTAEEAVHAAAACGTCGYFLPLAGAMRRLFGVCGNEWSPSDARVVSVDHGCGAHSETDVERFEPLPLPEPILDETGAEAVVIPRRTEEAESEGEAEGEPIAELEPVADAEAELVSDVEAAPVTGAEAEPVTDTEAEPVADAETQPIADAETQPVADAEVQPVAEGEPGAEEVRVAEPAEPASGADERGEPAP